MKHTFCLAALFACIPGAALATAAATQEGGVLPLTPPNNDTIINISEQIAQVGAWNNGDLFLKRGYFSCDTTLLKLVEIATGQEVHSWPDVLTYWPSLNVTHLHFEVRGTHDPQDQLHLKGEQNPHNWIGVVFGGWK
jgi:hypothetical protein